MDDKSLATGETVSDLNSTCASDEKVVNNHENPEILPDGSSKGSTFDPINASQENETKVISQTPGQRKRGRPRKIQTAPDLNSNNHEISENLPSGPPSGSSFDQLNTTRENESKGLSQTPGQRKRGRPRKVVTVSDLNSSCACDEKVVSNHESSQNLPDGPSGGSSLDQLNATQENESQTPGRRKRGRPRKNESMITTSQENNEWVDASLQEPDSKENKGREINKRMNKEHNNEFSKIKTHLRYLLNRMKYEQNFIDAYAGEGWKGQSLEKLRPEKELERAKSDINRYKLKIRDLFKRVDASCEEGRIPESLYDSEGLIDSEDIFCAKCRKIEVSLDNDIILCDGSCERGFHQFCLDPPLLKEQVPPGDQGWLCPACDCKADSFRLLNDSFGTDLSIEDNWEKVFPETVASGNKLDDTLGLPSDDSEDDDYNPDGPQLEEKVDAEDSSSDDADDLAAVTNNEQLGDSSDDSEDDDFNPDRVDSDDDEDVKMKGSGSEFTSDSDDLGDVKNEVASTDVQGVDTSGDKEELPEPNMENDDSAPITAKRNVERLDYKKLHDEAYGNISSDSSDDEDFYDSDAPSGLKTTTRKENRSVTTPVRNASKTLDVEGTSDKSGNKSSNRRIGKAATQRLYEAFKENHYPDRTVRENLVKELNLTHSQVSKWFGNARWSFNHPEGRTKIVKSPKR
ncbi:putative chromatin remodeling & transcription regulator Homeodomain-PHD family [Helianthus annuus]|uniref:Chromatin remodeling & transcription regulator Homeodomain-PHD family n=1 Tax=Helianthus annuus TaxID=4232 RepID=A0A251V5D1_HELAN|nr:pathogenesis-related homeodomain protein [Helianthus annuus]KAF5814113.1 putative chromatin remodeling & transcription regulator Homeodomain-PHD family [Helianthus annuus]KAJ0592789.1 putative chromatin remodeling & transcriptional activation HMG family [Helianthus annuus]KAJ0600439.1 putative chromatin remodeling & transcriptional activation HMG family [Helianthus annuus]KAJ0607788.1 putative chromatin remodeling & transcriptional activation HMG family [Helianthus annuus]KAJ0767852.1 putat